MICKLIVNRNGLLSACPTEQDFDMGNYHSDPVRFLVLSVMVSPNTRQHLWQNRDNAFILHEELPAQTQHPERVWYRINNGYLVKVKSTLKTA